ncbi:hypothetical protein [Deinococcus peraridilitoris]|uniref:hypothetical protein n=1 Tax=Deinococcus peraridilitoris TaxID=432329 RepID=UPI0003105A39|nr:hypothetical protein [Deinococcus peraridilitoris]
MDNNGAYLHFRPDFARRETLRTHIEADAGVQAKENDLRTRFQQWWDEHHMPIVALPQTKALMTLRAELLESFQSALSPALLLDRFKVAGVIASWWDANKYNLKTLAANGWSELLDGWIANATGDEADTSATGGIDRDRLLHALAPKAMQQLEALEEQKAEVEAALAELEGDPESEDENAALFESEQNAAKVKVLKKKLGDLKKQHKTAQAQALSSLSATAKAMSDEDRQALVLRFMREDLEAALDRYVTAHRNHIVRAVENWHDKYHVSLRALERERSEAALKLNEFMRELGYARA